MPCSLMCNNARVTKSSKLCASLSGRLQLEERGGEAPESGRHSDAAKNKQAIQLAQSLQLPSGILALIKEGARDTHESKTFRAVFFREE